MRRLTKFSLACVAGAAMIISNPTKVQAFEEGVAGIAISLENVFTIDDTEIALSTQGIIPGMTNMAVANVTDHLNIRKEPGENKKIIGTLPKNGGGTILKKDDGSGWTKIKSGKVTGYVSSEYILTGKKANKAARKVAKLVAISNANSLNVRKEPSVDSSVLTQVATGEELVVEEDLVVAYGEDHNKWVKVSVDNTEEGYIAKEYVNLSYELAKASSVEETQYGSGVSSTRVNLINSAKSHLGGRYVWGGTTLGSGVDCSGYTQALYRQHGISIPRTSGAQGHSGRTISSSELKVGDLVFYGSSSSSINHVAMYIGSGQVIHASNARTGIKISNMGYRTPVKYVSYINN